MRYFGLLKVMQRASKNIPVHHYSNNLPSFVTKHNFELDSSFLGCTHSGFYMFQRFYAVEYRFQLLEQAVKVPAHYRHLVHLMTSLQHLITT